jgi:glycosyltransferase involved in cell wall biosynthesis
MDHVILEIASGLGSGGAEKALKQRLEVNHPGFTIYACNTIPKLSKISLNVSEIVAINHLRSVNLFRFISNLSPDVVIVRSPRDCLRISILKFIYPRHFLAVYEAHSTFVSPHKFLNFPLKLLLRMALRNFDQIISVSIAVQKGDQVNSNSKSIVRYMGSTISEGPLARYSYQGIKFIFIGRMATSKRPLWLIRRINNIQEEMRLHSASFLFVGDGKLLTRVKNLTNKLALNDIVSFAGAVDDPSFHLRNSDWLVSASRNEGLPLVFFEAKLAGVSILSTPSGGGIELLDNGDILLKDFSSNEFEEKMKEILKGSSSFVGKKKSIGNKTFDAHQNSLNYYNDILKIQKNWYKHILQ